jgi:hypothetical protein
MPLRQWAKVSKIVACILDVMTVCNATIISESDFKTSSVMLEVFYGCIQFIGSISRSENGTTKLPWVIPDGV